MVANVSFAILYPGMRSATLLISIEKTRFLVRKEGNFHINSSCSMGGSAGCLGTLPCRHSPDNLSTFRRRLGVWRDRHCLNFSVLHCRQATESLSSSSYRISRYWGQLLYLKERWQQNTVFWQLHCSAFRNDMGNFFVPLVGKVDPVSWEKVFETCCQFGCIRTSREHFPDNAGTHTWVRPISKMADLHTARSARVSSRRDVTYGAESTPGQWPSSRQQPLYRQRG